MTSMKNLLKVFLMCFITLFAFAGQIMGQQKTITGRVVDALNEGMPGGGSIPSGATSVRSFGRLGVCAGLKIPKTWFDSTRLHLKNRECSNGNEGGLEFLELAKKSAV